MNSSIYTFYAAKKWLKITHFNVEILIFLMDKDNNMNNVRKFLPQGLKPKQKVRFPSE